LGRVTSRASAIVTFSPHTHHACGPGLASEGGELRSTMPDKHIRGQVRFMRGTSSNDQDERQRGSGSAPRGEPRLGTQAQASDSGGDVRRARSTAAMTAAARIGGPVPREARLRSDRSRIAREDESRAGTRRAIVAQDPEAFHGFNLARHPLPTQATAL
jgi:hypothetical protein